MKRSLIVNILLAVILSSSVVGCKKGPKNPTAIPDGRLGKVRTDGQNDLLTGGERVGDSTTNPLVTDTSKTVRFGEEDFERDTAHFQANTVYFDLDRSSVKAGEGRKLEEVATYLKGSVKDRLEIEGHCDDRGTEEYNRALGERRALALREYLINSGVAADRIATKSWGEDRPAVPGGGEAAWAKNRRGEFILLKPKF